MKVKHEAVVDTVFHPQVAESNQTSAMMMDDPSAKTIEFLRARLLAERATSKSARQQAQDIAEKVKDLHIRLETEIEQRKAAEAAMEKVHSVLKAKGIVIESTLLASANLNGQSMCEASPSDFVEGAKEVSGEVPSHTADSPHLEGVECPLGNRDEISTQKGILERTSELNRHSPVAKVTVDTCSTGDAPSTHSVESKVCVPLMHQHCMMDQVEAADHDKKEACTDRGTSDCMSDCITIFKEEIGTGQRIQQGLCITSKLKAMLQQIEEEVGALPVEQPLKVKLQGLAGHVANMLNRNQEAGLEIDCLGGSKQPDIINCSAEGVVAFETKNGTHMKLPVQSQYTNAIHVSEANDRRERLVKSLFPSPKAQLQQRHFLSPTSTLYTPAIKDNLLHSNMLYQRKSSCEFVNAGNRDPYVGQCLLERGPLSPQTIQYENPHSQITCPPIVNMGLEFPYLVEIPSPKGSDALSVGDKMGYTSGQYNEFWSPARASSGFEEKNAWSPARVERHSRAMLSNGYLINDELLMNLERGYNHQSMYCRKGFFNACHARDPRNFASRGTARQQLNDCSRCKDEVVSVMDDRNGKLGDTLMALDAARLHIQGEEVMGPPTPTAVDARLKRGHLYGDCVRQLPPEFQQHDTWRSHSHAPIVQFPPSPSSEQGYSPFERSHGVHRRSSSMSTNFITSEWDTSLQSRGEVHLGNGITLYTD